MIDKSEIIVKSVVKIDFVEMTRLVSEELTQTRNKAEYTLKREVKLKRPEAEDMVKCLLKEKYLSRESFFNFFGNFTKKTPPQVFTYF